MAKRMLVDATHPEETRVVVVNGNRLEELDFEIASRKQLKGNIYLAKVTRVEPSLQAAFVEYGGNRHGFLAFSEIHPDYYRIPVADREALMAEQRRRDEEYGHGDDNGAAAHADAVNGDGDGDENGDAPARHLSPMPSPIAVEALAAPVVEGDSPAGTDDEAPVADAAAGIEPPAEMDTDVVGGDDTEDVESQHRRRARPLRSYKIQEVIKRRQILLVQVTKEERGNKGAALTTYLSLPGRYCVLMPNTDRGGGISRKITNPADRKRLKEILSDLDIPDGMAVILRTAGLERSKPEIRRDLEYLLRLWDDIREQTLKSTAPCLIYEEANLIKRTIRDVYSADIDEVWVEGDTGFRTARDFMSMLMPDHTRRVQLYSDESIPLFHRYQVEAQIDAIHSPVVQLRSGGYIVINPTEALVAIDVNSGKSTRERNIEETAFKTNLEAAEEVARQLRLRDLAGLIVIDFIDMEEPRNNAAVERKIKEAMKNDRARIQLGRISPFGLLELSRQRLRPSLLETNFERCPHCAGTGVVRSVESAALHVLRAIEEEGIRKRSSEITVAVPSSIALYILNQKRGDLARIEERYGFGVMIQADDTLIAPDLRLERVKARQADEGGALVSADRIMQETDRDLAAEAVEPEVAAPAEVEAETAEGEAERTAPDAEENGDRRRRRRRRRRGRGEGRDGFEAREGAEGTEAGDEDEGEADEAPADADTYTEADAVPADTDTEAEDGADADEAEGFEGEDENGDGARKKRRRGKRGGRRRSRQREGVNGEGVADEADGEAPVEDVPAEETPAAEPTPAVAEEAPAPAAIPAPVVAEEAPVTEAPADEAPVAEAKPARKRAATPRKRKADAAEAAPPAVTEAPAAPAEEAPAPKKRTTRKKPAVAEPAPVDAVTAPVDEAPAPKKRTTRKKPAAAEPAPVDAVAAPVDEAPAPKKRTTRKKPAAAEPAPVDAVTAPVEQAPVPAEPAPAPAEAPALAEESAAEPAPGKPRRGWWAR